MRQPTTSSAMRPGIAFSAGALLCAAAASLLSEPAAASPEPNPMQFFEGRTVGTGTVRILIGKGYRTRSVGQGRFQPDGSMLFVQQVVDEGKPPRERRWTVRKIAPRRYSGTMSEALGPVAIDEIGGRFRFRFRMKGNLSIEQWLIPLPGGTTARNTLTIRKLGVKVGSGEGTLRKIVGR